MRKMNTIGKVKRRRSENDQRETKDEEDIREIGGQW